MSVIEDGAGAGAKMKVTAQNRALVEAKTESFSDSQAINGNRFLIGAFKMTLTSATNSDLLYLKNNGVDDIVVEFISFSLGASTGGSGNDVTVDIIKNPTGGTVVTDETAPNVIENTNFSSTKTLNADIYKGAEGKTLTGGTTIRRLIRADDSFFTLNIGKLVIPNGQSIGVSVTPGTSNTNMDVYVDMIVYRDAT